MNINLRICIFQRIFNIIFRTRAINVILVEKNFPSSILSQNSHFGGQLNINLRICIFQIIFNIIFRTRAINVILVEKNFPSSILLQKFTCWTTVEHQLESMYISRG